MLHDHELIETKHVVQLSQLCMSCTVRIACTFCSVDSRLVCVPCIQAGLGLEGYPAEGTYWFTVLQRMTCGDMVSNKNATCDVGTTYSGADTTPVTTTFQKNCCQATPKTCNNTLPATPGVKFDCSTQGPQVYVYDSSKDMQTPPNCCKPLACDAANGTTADYSCPAGYDYSGAGVAKFTNFTADCCQVRIWGIRRSCQTYCIANSPSNS